MAHNLFNSLQTFTLDGNRTGKFYSLPELEKQGVGPVSKLPVSIRIVLESVLRNCDGKTLTEQDVRTLANWGPNAERTEEIPFVVARILLQDFTGVPLLVDLAAMRSAVAKLGKDPKIIEPLVPVDLVVDHSVQVDVAGTPDAYRLNLETEFKRNRERYQFLKWGMQAFEGFRVVPPGIGICHQVNLEYLARSVIEKDGVYFPDTLVGTDSHTTMINGLGIVGWGVGGIEAEAGMLGQPIYILTPDVVGVHMTGSLSEGVTATDLVLHCTEILRKAKVVGKFVEYFGEGAATLAGPDRATIANMAPEYGATMGFFPVDEETCQYLLLTGRSPDHVDAVRNYFKAQGMFGIPRKGDCNYSAVIDLNLADVKPSVAGPKRPQDRIDLPMVKAKFIELLRAPAASGGYNKSPEELASTCARVLATTDVTGYDKPSEELGQRFPVRIGVRKHELSNTLTGGGEQATETVPLGQRFKSAKNTSTETEVEMIDNRPTPDRVAESDADFAEATADIGHGDVLIAAITSCTNTSNPSVMLAAGLLAKKAVERGLSVRPTVKTSLAPGSRVVTNYLEKTGLQRYLDQLGFNLVGYGCTTCIGNSGPLEPHIEEVVIKNDLIGASVLSGNRNFEARVHQNIKANFLMSPPLVVAFALAGRVSINLTTEPLGKDKAGQDVFLRDIWPSMIEVRDAMRSALSPETFRKLYSNLAEQNPMWNAIPSSVGHVYAWNHESTYIQEPPFFEKFGMRPGKAADIHGARPLAIFGDSVTTDHISPAGAIKPTSPAGEYLISKAVTVADFNSYGARRGNDQVMTRGTFANVRIKNLMLPGTEGGVTKFFPGGEQMSIYDSALKYQAAGTPLVVFAGHEYGTGSSRDWAAKGTQLLGVRAVIAESFERIHRSNLVGMGTLPCQFMEDTNAQTLKLDGSESFDLVGLEAGIKPRQELTLVIHRADGSTGRVPVRSRIDTPIEVDYYLHGGILPYVLRQLLATG
jgi:aconitate hydratase